MLYRIFTEDIPQNHKAIEKAIAKYFEGFTLLKAKGYWRLQRENSLIIEIVTTDQDAVINKIAQDIKVIGNQEAVLIQKINNNQWLI